MYRNSRAWLCTSSYFPGKANATGIKNKQTKNQSVIKEKQKQKQKTPPRLGDDYSYICIQCAKKFKLSKCRINVYLWISIMSFCNIFPLAGISFFLWPFLQIWSWIYYDEYNLLVRKPTSSSFMTQTTNSVSSFLFYSCHL